MPLPGNQKKQDGGNLPDPAQIHPCPTPPFLIILILHFYYNASASGTTASSGTPSTSSSLYTKLLPPQGQGKADTLFFILIPHKTHCLLLSLPIQSEMVLHN